MLPRQPLLRWIVRLLVAQLIITGVQVNISFLFKVNRYSSMSVDLSQGGWGQLYCMSLLSGSPLKIGYSKTFVKQPLSKRQKIDFQDQLSLNASQKYCRMLQGEHSAILSTFIQLQFVIKIFGLSFLSGHFTQVLLYIIFKQKELYP